MYICNREFQHLLWHLLQQLPSWTAREGTRNLGVYSLVHMQQPPGLEEVSSPRSTSDQSAATPNTDYLQEALDTLVVPPGLDYNDFRGPYQAPSSWPNADLALHPSPAAADLDASSTAVEIDTAAVGPTGVLCSEADGSCSTDASKRKLNREHQRRFRMRSKVCNKLQVFLNPVRSTSKLHLHFRQGRKPSRQNWPPPKQSFRSSKLSVSSCSNC